MERKKRFQALPQIDEDTFKIAFGQETSILNQYLKLWEKGLAEALARIDEELAELWEANPQLAKIIYCGIEGLTRALTAGLGSHFGELVRVNTRLMSYFNIFLVLHTLDLQLRKERRLE